MVDLVDECGREVWFVYPDLHFSFFPIDPVAPSSDHVNISLAYTVTILYLPSHTYAYIGRTITYTLHELSNEDPPSPLLVFSHPGFCIDPLQGHTHQGLRRMTFNFDGDVGVPFDRQVNVNNDCVGVNNTSCNMHKTHSRYEMLQYSDTTGVIDPSHHPEALILSSSSPSHSSSIC